MKVLHTMKIFKMDAGVIDTPELENEMEKMLMGFQKPSRDARIY